MEEGKEGMERLREEEGSYTLDEEERRSHLKVFPSVSSSGKPLKVTLRLGNRDTARDGCSCSATTNGGRICGASE